MSSFLFFFSFFSFCVFSFLSLALPLALAFGCGFFPLKVFGGVFGTLGLLPAFELWKLVFQAVAALPPLASSSLSSFSSFSFSPLFSFLFIFLLFGFHGHLRSLAVARAPRYKYLAVVFTGLLCTEQQKVCNWIPGIHYLYMLICWSVYLKVIREIILHCG